VTDDRGKNSQEDEPDNQQKRYFICSQIIPSCFLSSHKAVKHNILAAKICPNRKKAVPLHRFSA